MQKKYNQSPIDLIRSINREIAVFRTDVADSNIDKKVIQSFGEEWKKFNEFSNNEIEQFAKTYFDIIDDKIINKNIYGIDIGCGTGRWTKYLLEKIGFMEAIDPSDAIYAADKLLGDAQNVRLAKASIDNIPFDDESFDFGMSIGVLHHVPDTQKAMSDCVRKVKIGGYFYVYLYYNLENRGPIFRFLLSIAGLIRKIVSSLPSGLKKFVCDVLACVIYMPIIMLCRLLNFIGLKSAAKRLPLSVYLDKTFFVIRNDTLDRFGTKLEQRFSQAEVRQMMKNAGLDEIIIADTEPFWHALGKRVG